MKVVDSVGFVVFVLVAFMFGYHLGYKGGQNNFDISTFKLSAENIEDVLSTCESILWTAEFVDNHVPPTANIDGTEYVPKARILIDPTIYHKR